MISILCFEIVNGLSDGKIMKSKDYSKNSLPGKKVDVKLSTYLASILEVDEEKQTLSLELSLRMMWKDERLTLSDKALNELEDVGEMDDAKYFNMDAAEISEIWVPDLYITGSVNIRHPKYLIDPSYMRIYEDSRIRINKRVNFYIGCNMEFQRFPLDVQVCDVKFESWKYESHKLNLSWEPRNNLVSFVLIKCAF